MFDILLCTSFLESRPVGAADILWRRPAASFPGRGRQNSVTTWTLLVLAFSPSAGRATTRSAPVSRGKARRSCSDSANSAAAAQPHEMLVAGYELRPGSHGIGVSDVLVNLRVAKTAPAPRLTGAAACALLPWNGGKLRPPSSGARCRSFTAFSVYPAIRGEMRWTG